MTPERAVLVLRAALASLDTFIQEAEEIDQLHPGAASHLALAMRQSRMSLQHLLDTGAE